MVTPVTCAAARAHAPQTRATALNLGCTVDVARVRPGYDDALMRRSESFQGGSASGLTGLEPATSTVTG
jgi:hypothetical protein